ncbi:hypothetical protein [Streptomyces sp. NPDC056464]|uniref:hypothetical protein n=1 Tax=Streptomyces sp. NPDC056464 TaxID=3345828 RepID=UPI00368E36F8
MFPPKATHREKWRPASDRLDALADWGMTPLAVVAEMLTSRSALFSVSQLPGSKEWMRSDRPCPVAAHRLERAGAPARPSSETRTKPARA